MLSRLSILCAVLATLLAAPAAAETNNEQWGFIESDQDVRLFYGVAESEAVTLSFICEPKRKKLILFSAALPRTARHGRRGTIRLVNGSSQLEFVGKTARGRDGTVFFLASIAFDTLETGTSLRIETLGARETLPLDGIREPLSQMRQACR